MGQGKDRSHLFVFLSLQSFGMEWRKQTDFGGIAQYVGTLSQKESLEYSDEERALIVSGEHPNVDVCVHETTGMPMLRIKEGVPKGTILGQLATRVIVKAMAEPSDETLAGYRRNCFAFEEEFVTSLPYTEVIDISLLEPEEPIQLEPETHQVKTIYADNSKPVQCQLGVCNHKFDATVGAFESAQALRDHWESLGSLLETTACPWKDCALDDADPTRMFNHIMAVHGNFMLQCSNCATRMAVHEQGTAIAHVTNCKKPKTPKKDLKAAPKRPARTVQIRYETGRYCNAFGFLRSSALENLDANVQLVVALLNGRPYLCVETTEILPGGTELLSDWDDHNMHVLLRYVMISMASHSHASHIYRCTLENLYDIYQLPRPQLTPVRPVQDCPTVLWLDYIRKDSLSIHDFVAWWKQMPARPSDQMLPLVGPETAFRESECTLVAHNIPSSDCKKLLSLLKAPDRPPRWQDVFADRPKMAHALLFNSDCPNVEIRRIDYLYHPVRFCNPPSDRPQYGIFAKAKIRAEEPIVCYKGEVITQREHDHLLPLPQYTFDLGLDLSLHINADDNGNEGRYVNDCFGRVWEAGSTDAASANARYLICWDDIHGIPVLFIMAGPKGICRGEEIVVDYGQYYWNPLMQELTRRHARFYANSSQIIEQLQNDLRQNHNIRVPEPLGWSELLRHGEESQVFRTLPKLAVRDYQLATTDDTADTVDVHIDHILEKRVMPFGVQYLVQWQGYDWSHNTWKHAADLPPAEVLECEQLFEQRAGLQERELRVRKSGK